MSAHRFSAASYHVSRITSHARSWASLILFSLLTVLMLYPLSTNLSSMAPEPTDPLLNVWRMQWNARAFLSGPAGIANLFDTNIFYPFPLTLAYSEHFLMMSAQALPFLLIFDSHLVGLNWAVLLTFILSGYGMALLVTGWTGYRLAGLVAGLLFAFSPHRFGQLNHLELLVTEWLPLTLLALHWTLTRPGWRYPVLFGIFFNLQALSGFHFSLNLTIACVLLALVYTLSGRVCWRRGLWLAGALSIIITFLINWPVWRMYLRFSDVMGAVRTPGEVRIYSAALTDYLTTIPHNWLYGWTFGRWQSEGHQFQPLMPVGIIGLLLAVIGILAIAPIKRRSPQVSDRAGSGRLVRLSAAGPATIFLIGLTLLALLLSFGLNEHALGPAFAPLLKFSPYVWLYDHVAIFQGIRAPGRFGILAVVGLVGLAGWGTARLLSYLSRRGAAVTGPARSISLISLAGLALLILLETWSAPLRGPEFPAGRNIAPVYQWLRQATPTDTVILELPFEGPSEFSYEYVSSYHWRRLANGGSGYTPPIYKDLRQWFNNFPDPRSVDVSQQLGIDLIILHPASYQPDAWQRVLADLPLYLPAIDRIDSIGEALVLHLAEPQCRADPARVQAGIAPTELDGRPNAVAVTYHNTGPAAFVADVRQISQLTLAGGGAKNFIEPLVTPAGESQAVIVPLPNDSPQPVEASLISLGRTIAAGDDRPLPLAAAESFPWQPLGLNFADGPQLAAYSLSPETLTPCSTLTIALNWQAGRAGDTAVVQLVDPFGRLINQDEAQPWLDAGQDRLDTRSLPLAGSLPPGRYGLRVFIRAAEGIDRPVITAEGATIPVDRIPPLPLVIHPAPTAWPAAQTLEPAPIFGEAMTLLGGQVAQDEVAAGDWLRFSLVWRAEQSLDQNLTVFTQLLGPDGRVWGQRDNQPGGGWYGVSLWQPGSPVVDDYAFQIPPDAPPGAYRLIAGLYHSDSLQRLTTPTGADFVDIAGVTVTP